jgi:hypothetical protein
VGGIGFGYDSNFRFTVGLAQLRQKPYPGSGQEHGLGRVRLSLARVRQNPYPGHSG